MGGNGGGGVALALQVPAAYIKTQPRSTWVKLNCD